MNDKIRAFMAGRYGNDQLNSFILIVAVVFMVLGLIFGKVFSLIAALFIIYAFYRMLSRNFAARSEENRRFMPLYGKISPYINITKARLTSKGQYRYFLCPSCKKVLRVPKGKGKITLRCPCGTSFKGKS